MKTPYQPLFENFEKILSNLPCNLYWKDINSVYIGCNQQLATSLGLASPADIVGKTDFDFGWEQKTAQNFIDFDKRVMREKKTLKTLDTFTQLDGHIVNVLTNKSPLFDESSNVIGVLATSTDITERLEIEDALKKEKEQAKIAAKTKSSVVHNLRHDWLTPFCGIFSINEHLHDIETDPEKKVLLEMAKESSRLMMQHTESILEMIGASEGIPPVQEAPFNLYELADNICKMFLPKINSKKIKFKKEIEQAPTLVKGDKVRTERILMSMLSNAVKFTNDYPEINFSINIDYCSDDKLIINFVFADNGIGMSNDQIANIYEPLYRAYPSYEAKYMGAGTGLTIVKQYIGDLDGEIVCQSKMNEGTTFIITLPFKRSLTSKETIAKLL